MKTQIIDFLILAVLLFFCRESVYSQDTNTIKFLPLKVGNVWVYQCTASGYQCGYCTKRIKVSMLNSTVLNGKTYFQSQVTSTLISGSCTSCGAALLPFANFIRIDSFSCNVYLYSSSSGCLYSPDQVLEDSLKARLYDSIRYNCQAPAQWNAYVCEDTNNITVFGESRPARAYGLEGFEGGWGRTYIKGIGVFSCAMVGQWCTDQTQLRGCVIDGIVYGDTSTIVSIKQISNKVPEYYNLSQNYPNPFNPKTMIKFCLPNPSEGGAQSVRLVIYDVLGKEVASLIPPLWGGQEGLKPGTYEVTWDGSNYASGIYFYKLTTADFSETKKMVLIK